MRIKIPNFKKWQKPTEGRREWFAIAANFAFDSSVQDATRRCPDSIICYLALWPEMDYETESCEMDMESLRSLFKRAVNNQGNKFDFERRLDALKKSGLILLNFAPISDANQMHSECISNGNQMVAATIPNGSEMVDEWKPNGSQIETPQTQAESVTTNVHTIHTYNTSSVVGETAPLLTKYQPVMILNNQTTGDRVEEAVWIFRGAVKKLQSGRGRVNLLSQDLGQFCGQNPEGKKMVYTWLSYPPEERMAATVYAMDRPSVVNEFDYALGALTQGWDGYRKFLPAAQKAVENNDYEVEV